mgnify:FL=1
MKNGCVRAGGHVRLGLYVRIYVCECRRCKCMTHSVDCRELKRDRILCRNRTQNSCRNSSESPSLSGHHIRARTHKYIHTYIHIDILYVCIHIHNIYNSLFCHIIWLLLLSSLTLLPLALCLGFETQISHLFITPYISLISLDATLECRG